MNIRTVAKHLVFVSLILTSIFVSNLFAISKDNFNIVSNSKNQIDIQFNLGEWNLQNTEKNGISCKEIVSNAKHRIFVDETETMPVYSAMIAIPDGMDVEVITDYTDTQSIRSVNLIHKDLIVNERGDDTLYPLNKVVISEPGQFRDFRVVNLNVYPFQYNTRSNELSVTKSASISLRFVPSRNAHINPAKGYYSNSFDNLYRALILNYDLTRDEAAPINSPVLLIVYPTGGDATFTTKLNEFIDWKKRKGYVVNTLSFASSGVSNVTIKNSIQSQYNSITTRPDVVMIIGDVGGTYSIPTWDETNTGFVTSNGDYSYTLLAGSDNYGDVQIGRISISSSTDFTNYVSKVYKYERDVNVNTAGWLDKMLLVGDTDPSGISCVNTNEYIYDISRLVNPSYTYTKLYSNDPLPADIDQGINTGAGFYNYRGYINMSGWSPSASLVNGIKLNHGVLITCATGNFHSGTSTTEAYVRLGTESVPAGGITAIGMSTSSTHTGFNNCLTGGVFDGIFVHGMRNMGEALLHAKIYQYNVFQSAHPIGALFFNRICNLIGDPTVEIWITAPKTFQFVGQTTIISGTTTYEVTVKNVNNLPVEGVTVNIFQSGNINLTGYSNNIGKVYFTIPGTLSGNIIATLSKHDYKPLAQTITISGTGLVYQNSIIDDDHNGNSIGNSNGVINAGETIEYGIQIKNTSTTTIASITGNISCDDQYVTMLNSSLSFPNAVSGSIVTSNSSIRFSVNSGIPDNHPITFYLNGSSSNGAWTSVIQHFVRSCDLDFMSYTISGSNTTLEPGESTGLYLTLINNGSESVSNVNVVLRSLNHFLVVSDSLKYFGNVNAGSSISNSSNQFSITANALTAAGMTIPMQIYLYNNNGFSDTESFYITIGTTSVNAPLGQDEYGYFIYGMEDVDYASCPTYNWIGIAPAEGGSGIALDINDVGVPYSTDEGDQVGCDAVEVVNLPFTFKYYGVNYNHITVVSNGFLTMGATANHDFRNWRLPGPVGPNAMIAAFWDDLSTMTGGIYKYYDSINHWFIIEWYNLRLGRDRTSEETFQIILYDPLYHETSTGDGPIKIQYKVFNNADSPTTTTAHGCYSTIGIKDHTGLRGLEYSFNNQYPIAAASITNQSALYITTAPIPPNIPLIIINQTVLNDSNSNGYIEPLELVDVTINAENLGTNPANETSVYIYCGDPYINIRINQSYIGSIAGLSNATNPIPLQFEVASNCPNNYTIRFSVSFVASGGYSWNRNFTIAVNTPILSIAQIIMHDSNGNNYAEPGEVIDYGFNLSNTGLVCANNIVAIMSNNDPWITVLENTSTFNPVSPSGSSLNNAYFSIQVSPDCPSGYIATIYITINSLGYTVTRNYTLTVYKPSVTLTNWYIDDLATNSNCLVDPGETGFIVLNLYNSQMVSVSNADVSIVSDNSNFVLLPSTYRILTIDKQSTYQLAVQYNANSMLLEGTEVTLTINVSSDNADLYTVVRSFRVGNDITFHDFETSNAAYVATNSITPGWAYGSSTYSGAYSGTKVWGCVLSNLYGANATYELVSPSFKLNTGASLSFYHKYDLELSTNGLIPYDGGRVMISTNNGVSWSLLTPQGGYPFSSVSALSGPGYCGLLNTWTLATINLSSYSHQTVKIKWQMKTDGAVFRNGWFIDDVKVIGTPSTSSIGVISGLVTLSHPVASVNRVNVVTSGLTVNPDSIGNFKIRVSNGTYTIKARLNGFAERTTNATVQLNNTVSNVNLLLEYLTCPQNLTWMAQQNQVNMRWDTDLRPNFLHYNIYRKIGTGSWMQIAESTQSNYTDVANVNTWIDYKITSDFGTSESISTNTIRFLPDDECITPPQKPINFKIIKNGNSMRLSWDRVNHDIDDNLLIPWEYRIYSSNEAYFDTSISNFVSSTTNNWIDLSIDNDHCKYYKIRAMIGFMNN